MRKQSVPGSLSSRAWVLLHTIILLSCGIYTALVSLIFGTAIHTFFSILMKMLYSCRNTCRACCLSANLIGLITPAFESSESVFLLKINGYVGVIPT